MKLTDEKIIEQMLSKERLLSLVNDHHLNSIQISQLFTVDIAPIKITNYAKTLNIDIDDSWKFNTVNYQDVMHLQSVTDVDSDIIEEWRVGTFKRMTNLLSKRHIDHTKCDKCHSPITNKNFIIENINETDDSLLSNYEVVCESCYNEHYNHVLAGNFTTITKKFEFEYSHFLPNHPRKCRFLHGHRGQLEVTVKRRVDPNGFVIDFSNLKKAVESNIIERFDHNFLNNYLPMPTCENTLVYIWAILGSTVKGLDKITLYEQSDSYATLTANQVKEFVI